MSMGFNAPFTKTGFYDDMPTEPIKLVFSNKYKPMKTKKRSKSKERMKKQSRRNNRR